MKKLRYFILILIAPVLLANISCQKLDRLTQFNLELSDTVVIPSSVGLNLPFSVFTPPITMDTEEVFAINDTRKDLIEEINLQSLHLEIIAPDSRDFSFLNSIEIFLDADSLDATLVAWKYDIPNDIGSSLDLEVSGSDLTEYLLKDAMQLKVTTVTDKIPLTDVSVKMDAGFYVNAKILGI